MILCNFSEKNNRIFNFTTKDIYALPILAKTSFTKYKKLYVRQIFVSDKQYIHYEQYEIKDKVPDLFYNQKLQKYFENNIGFFVDYEFKDNKNLIQQKSEKMIQILNRIFFPFL